MAEFRLTFGTYAVASTLSVLALLLRTWYVHEELYTVVAVLTTQKVALAILYNFIFMLFVALGKVVLYVLLGQLRDLEVEQVLDSGRGFLLDTVLFLVLSSPTLDGADVSTYALAKFLLLVVALKTAHLVVQIQGATMFEVGHPRAPALVRVCVVLSALLSLDVFAVHFFFTNASGQSTFYLWLLFECLGMLASCAICIMKFGVHLVDLRLDNGWTSKSAVIFYLELMHDVTSLVIFLLFLAVFFISQPSRLPLYMTADIIHVVKALYKRILSLKKYRSLTRNLETRFPDATPEEVEAADTCIICRDFLFDGSKKLPCSHIFHIDCLRSWLVQQQSCPTCRADIPTDDTAAPATAAPRDGSESTAGGSRAPAAAQQQHRRGGSASRQQQQQDGGADASAFSGSSAAEGSVANARHAATAREEKRRQSSEGHDSVSAAPASDGASGAVEAVAGQSTRMAAVDVVANAQKSAVCLNNAQVSDVADPLVLLDTRLRRSSGRLEAAAAAALAAAASTAAVAPSLRTSAPTSCRRVDYAEELEAALRLRVAQAEAVITGALAQALAMTYQMCDLYRLHASLWTIEAQRAQLEACYTLLQSSELRRSSPAAAQADFSVVEGIRQVPTTCIGASGTADPAADAPPLPDTPTTHAAGPARSVVALKPRVAEAEKHQSELATAEGASGIDAALGGNEENLPVSCPSVSVEGACGLQPASSKDPAEGDAGFVENSILVDRAAPSSAGALPGSLAVHEGAEATSGDTGLAANEGVTAGGSRRADGGRGVGRDIRQNSGREFVVVCPSHLFHQAMSPYFPAYNEMSVFPFAHGADGHPVDDNIRVKGSADGSYAAGNDIHSSPGISISNSNRSLASASSGSSSNVLLSEISGTYGNVATAGQVSFGSPWNATPVAWQGLRGSALPPPPSVATFSSLPGLLRGIGEALAAHQNVERATSSPPAAAVEQSVTRASESSAGVKLPPPTEYAGTVPPSHSMAAHVASGTSTRTGREEEIHSHFGNSPYTSLATDALMRAAAAGMGEETSRSSSAGAATFDGVTNAMAAELERLRKEQHRRWKEEGNTNSSSSNV